MHRVAGNDYKVIIVNMGISFDVNFDNAVLFTHFFSKNWRLLLLTFDNRHQMACRKK